MTDISLRNSVASERQSVYVLRGTSSFSICFDSLCCFTLKDINDNCCCSKIRSDLSNLAWSLVSKWPSEGEVSEARVSNSFSICSDEKWFGYICCFTLSSINSSSCFYKLWSDGEILDWNLVSKWSSEDGGSEARVNTSFLMCSDEIVFDSMCFFPFNSINYSFFCETLIRWRKLGLESGIKVIFIRWSFRGESKHLIYNELWGKPVIIFFYLKWQGMNLIF